MQNLAIFTAALVMMESAEAASKQNQERDYLNFMSRHNKNIEDSDNYRRRLQIYQENDDYIEEVNMFAELSLDFEPLVLEHNWASDLNEEEFYQSFLGMIEPEEEEPDVIDVTTMQDPDDLRPSI